MNGFKEYDNFDALGLAALVKTGEVSPEQLLIEAINRRNAVNSQINAVIYNMDDLAFDSIKKGLPQGTFAGVPFLIKDLLAAYAGVPLTSGSRAFKNYVPDFDSELMKRYKASGVVIFGKTNTPEFGLMGVTEPVLHGITRNPWNLQRTSGGSSGGSAAAVAAGIVPMASGGDGGGSLRIPASCCGMDAAYCSEALRIHSRSLGHVPLIDHNPRGGEKQPFALHEAQRYQERTQAERTNGRLKDDFGGRHLRVKGHAKVMAHLMFALLALSAEQWMRLHI